jgi:hypothetical protein
MYAWLLGFKKAAEVTLNLQTQALDIRFTAT